MKKDTPVGESLPLRAALYPRVSTEEQAKYGLSIHDQQGDLEEYARAHGMRIVGVFADAGYSARKKVEKRPAMLALLEAVKRNEVDIVLVTKLDRWFRNIGEYYKVQEILEAHNVSWRTIYEDYDTSTAAGRLKINIMLAVAQDEADRTSERIKKVFDGKRARLEPLTGDKPFGYTIEGKRYVKDPETEAAVDAFFRKYMACGSVSATQDYIKSEHGIFIPYQGADKLLRSTAYYGRYFGVDGMCPAYITKAQYDAIQLMRKRVMRRPAQNRVYLFSGLIFCPVCGGRMGGRKNQNVVSSHYNCSNHFCRRIPCTNNRSISEAKLERYLLNALDAKFAEYKRQTSRVSGARRKDYSSEIAALKGKLSRLKELYLNELISLDEYKRDRAGFMAKLDELEANQAALAAPAPSGEKIDGLLQGDWKGMYADLPKDKQQEFWRIVIKEIRLYPDRHIEFDLNL